MDQLKSFVATASKYGFWIGTALVLLLSVGIWYVSTGTLVEATDSATGRLDGKVRQINTVNAELDQTPNESSHAEMRNMVEERQKEVLASWRTLFNRQEPHLKWPSDPRYERLVNRYKDWFPIEQYVSFPPEEENRIPEPWRQVYRDHIGDEPEKIAAIASAEWTVNFDKGRRDSQRNRLEADQDDVVGIEDSPVVAWAESSQTKDAGQPVSVAR